MSEGINKVLLLGNLGAEPELKKSAGGTALLQLRLATNESWIDKNKQVQARTEWHNVVVWGSRAEALAKVLRKGSAVLVEGTLRTTSFEKEGAKRSRTEILAREIYLTGRKPDGAQSGQGVPPATVFEPMPF